MTYSKLNALKKLNVNVEYHIIEKLENKGILKFKVYENKALRKILSDIL